MARLIKVVDARPKFVVELTELELHFITALIGTSSSLTMEAQLKFQYPNLLEVSTRERVPDRLYGQLSHFLSPNGRLGDLVIDPNG